MNRSAYFGGAGLLVCVLGCSPAPQDADGGDGDDHHEAPNDPHEGEVVLDAHVVERNGIVVEPATKRLLLGALEVPAEVQINPDNTAHVTSPVEGRWVTVSAALGDVVSEGDVLGRLASTDLGRARAAVASARARKRSADAELERADALVAEGIAAKKTKIEAKARAASAQARVAEASATLSVYDVRGGSGPDLALRTPLAGTVIERHATRGERVDSDEASFVVADLSQLWVMGRVYEQDLRQVSKGASAEVALIAYPGQTWPGVVDYVSSTLDVDTRSAAVRVVLENPDGLLRPGMFGTLALAESSEQDPKVLSVAETAVMTIEGRTVVFVRSQEPDTFVARDIVPGGSAHGFVEVREGLAEGEPVVTKGAFVLKSAMLASSLGGGHAH